MAAPVLFPALSVPTRLDGSVPKPDDRPSAHASGVRPYRLTLLGPARLVHEGVRCHDLSLAGWLARSLADETGHGVDVDLVVRTDRRILRPDGLPADGFLRRSDAAVLVLEVDPRLSPAHHRRLRALLEDLRLRLPRRSRLLVLLVSELPAEPRPAAPGSDRRARLTSDLTTTLRDLDAGLLVVPPATERRPSARFAEWGAEIARSLAPRLGPPLAQLATSVATDEARRRAAAARLQVPDEAWQTELGRTVTLARGAYGARFAALGILDGDRTRFVVRSGFSAADAPREETLCTCAADTAEGLIVGDAAEDDRFAGRGSVRDGTVRFYAGYPVDSADGEPVGVLCVFDPEPRTVVHEDLAVLRSFGAAAQQGLWRLERRGPRTSPPR